MISSSKLYDKQVMSGSTSTLAQAKQAMITEVISFRTGRARKNGFAMTIFFICIRKHPHLELSVCDLETALNHPSVIWWQPSGLTFQQRLLLLCLLISFLAFFFSTRCGLSPSLFRFFPLSVSIFCPCQSASLPISALRFFLVACYATLHPAMSVGRWSPFGQRPRRGRWPML